MINKKIILTGDRPTGPLHLGHYAGSLKNRVELQNDYEQYILIADVQALTDNFDHPEKIRMNIIEVALDYLAVGINPNISTILVQSMIPEIAELTIYFLNLVTLSRLERNPTVKEELKTKKFSKNITAGFLMYPVHQASDITIFNANLVPVGEDQLPMIEQASELVKKFNSIYGDILIKPEALVSSIKRLSGIDGKAKMSKSLNNAIYLCDSEKQIREKVMKMYTDPNHLRIGDAGNIKGNIVFEYLDAFSPDKNKVLDLKQQYQKGGLGDVVLKKYLIEVLEDVLRPIRQKRIELSQDPAEIMNMVKRGTERARNAACKTIDKVREALKINYFR